MTLLNAITTSKNKTPKTHNITTTMQQVTLYTSIYAPVLFFFSGITIVILLNKFIGKHSSNKSTK